MKAINIGFICLSITFSCPAQTFSSIVPDSVYARFFLFDKKVNRLGVHCNKDIFDFLIHPDSLKMQLTIEGLDSLNIKEYFDNYGFTKLHLILKDADYDFFQKQIQACQISNFANFFTLTKSIFNKSKDKIEFKITKSIEIRQWFVLPVFNIEKNIAITQWDVEDRGCLQVYVFQDGYWQHKFDMVCWIE